MPCVLCAGIFVWRVFRNWRLLCHGAQLAAVALINAIRRACTRVYHCLSCFCSKTFSKTAQLLAWQAVHKPRERFSAELPTNSRHFFAMQRSGVSNLQVPKPQISHNLSILSATTTAIAIRALTAATYRSVPKGGLRCQQQGDPGDHMLRVMCVSKAQN